MTTIVLKSVSRSQPMTKVLLHQKKLSAAKTLLSFLILSVVSVQLYSAVLIAGCKVIKIPLCYLPDEPGLYPFLDYPMYARAKAEGDVVKQRQLMAIFSDGTEKPLQAEDFGLSPYWYLATVLPAFENQKLDKIKTHIEAYQQQGNQPFVAFRVDVLPTTVSADGVIANEKIIGDRVPLPSGAQ